jgi:hypothetical protein
MSVAVMKANMDLRKDTVTETLVPRIVDGTEMFDAGQHSRPFPGSTIDDRMLIFGTDVGKGWDYG